MAKPLLELRELTMAFGGVVALDSVSLELNPGEILAIIGPNGAGKTTIFNCISGLYKPTSGGVFFKGKSISGLKPHQVAGLGIARTFQNIELFSHMSTLENLLLGRHRHMKCGVVSGMTMLSRFSPAAKVELEHRRKVEEVIDFLDLQSSRNKFVGALPYGTRKVVELGRALAMEPELLLLDEPAAGMNLEEKQDMMIWIKDIQEEFGVTVLLIEHDMSFVSDLSDRVIAINYGLKIAEGKPVEVQSHPEVLKAYLGEEGV